ncbi:MAG: hypothetical protein DRG30_07705 [Epsilonproteobacteria bacterium]|nr:MAG: hypothetical protein DRG30_07705 [Campylobacterota bacterium]
MIWKRYRNEFIVLIVFVLMLTASLYKNSAADKLDAVNNEMKIAMVEIGEIIALKKQWGNDKLTKEINKIKKGITAKKIKLFSVKSKKLMASFVELSDKEMNGIVLKLENIAVQISRLDIKRKNESYSMEIKCKW